MLPSVDSLTPLSNQASSLSQERSGSELQVRTEQVSLTAICNACKKVIPRTSMCSRCKSVFYCAKPCQEKDWQVHKLLCIAPKVKLSLDILTPFKSKLQKIGNQNILIYSPDPSYTAPKNSLIKLSDLAENLGCMAMDEFLKQMTNKIQVDSKLKNTTIPIASSQIQKLYLGPLNGWIKDAELDSQFSSILPLLSTLKVFIEKYFTKPGHEALKVDTADMMASIRFLHEEMVMSLWYESFSSYPDYTMKNICDIFKTMPQNMILQLNCIAFAFLKAGEKKFEIYPHSYLSDLLKNLQEWNYYPVTEPQEGDFVVYFDANKNKPSHIALLTASGKVCSKPGLRYPFAVEHPLNHISTLYGKGGFAFFRKKIL